MEKEQVSVTEASRSRREIWQGFLNDVELLARHRVTEDEIETLKTFAPFGTLTGTDDIVFILERLRRLRKHW
jgi:hypothetical protein